MLTNLLDILPNGWSIKTERVQSYVIEPEESKRFILRVLDDEGVELIYSKFLFLNQNGFWDCPDMQHMTMQLEKLIDTKVVEVS